MKRGTRQLKVCQAPSGTCSHPDICQSHGCAALEARSKPYKPIPISAAEGVAKRYGYHQVVIIARHVGDDGIEHVTTYGIDPSHCAVAAQIGNYIKHKIMGWPE